MLLSAELAITDTHVVLDCGSGRGLRHLGYRAINHLDWIR